MWALGRGRGHDPDGHTPPLPADRRLNDLGDCEYSLARPQCGGRSFFMRELLSPVQSPESGRYGKPFQCDLSIRFKRFVTDCECGRR